jgi:molybdopterin synthase sulfur carrier subunit
MISPSHPSPNTIHLLYFGELGEQLHLQSEYLPLPTGCLQLADVLAALRCRGGVWDALLGQPARFRLARNQHWADASSPVQAGDEVAIFSLVTGG